MDVLKPAAIFKDKMVLQRQKSIDLWGTGPENAHICVDFDSDKYFCTVQDGEWNISVPPIEAGGPYTVKIYDESTCYTFKDVMIGEVWFACGQSNMEYILRNCPSCSQAVKEVQNRNDIDIRYYETPKQSYFSDSFDETEQKSGWSKLSDKNFEDWSAVAFYAALKLAGSLPGITIGIAACFWGGTSASCWLDEQTLSCDRQLSEYITDYKKATDGKSEYEMKKEYEDYTSELRQWTDAQFKLLEKQPDLTWSEISQILGPYKWCPPLGPYSQYRPHSLYCTMFSRIYRYSKRGIWYYQGESDDHKPKLYYKLFSALITQWRTVCSDDRLPFIFVQLPMYSEEGHDNDTDWAYIREAQQRINDTYNNTSMVVSLDLGEHHNIHPAEKRELGTRLADKALSLCYNINTCSQGPVYLSSYKDKNSMIISFSGADDGFIIKGDTIKGFETAGQDRIYYSAKACITDKNKIRIYSDKVIDPVYARYNFVNYAPVTLFGKNMIPAAPFRTSLFDEK